MSQAVEAGSAKASGFSSGDRHRAEHLKLKSRNLGRSVTDTDCALEALSDGWATVSCFQKRSVRNQDSFRLDL